jgi:uncharacterized protein YegJ (DUF2314 family)
MQMLSSIMAALLAASMPAPRVAITQQQSQAEAIAEERAENVKEVEAADPEMNAAIAEAQRTLPDFIAIVRNPPAGITAITFKFPLGGTEHIWVSDVKIYGDTFTGRLANVPLKPEHHQGDAVRVPFKDVSDWAYLSASGVMQGHRTTRVLLGRIDPEQAKQIRTYFGW